MELDIGHIFVKVDKEESSLEIAISFQIKARDPTGSEEGGSQGGS